MSGWGPDGRQAAVSLSFDNFGEAALIGLGLLDADAPVGSHPSATETLPEYLRLLDETHTKASFFVEGWNADVYPDALKRIADAGHEIGCHAWQHEPWYQLSGERQVELLTRSTEAYSRLGLTVRGFRPPGGIVPDTTLRLLPELGYTYHSSLGGRAGIQAGVAVLPGDMGAVDATYYDDGAGDSPFAQFRRLSAATTSEDALLEGCKLALEDAVEANGYVSPVFHFMISSTADRINVIRRAIEYFQADGRVWFAPCGEVADWILSHPEDFPKLTGPAEDPGWWSKAEEFVERGLPTGAQQ